MASAPRPGVVARRDATEASKSIMTITLRGIPYRLAIGSIPLGEKLAVRKETGMPFEAFIAGENAIGEDSVIVLWWLARRAQGESLSLLAAADEWPTDIGPDELQVEVTEPKAEDSDPEA